MALIGRPNVGKSTLLNRLIGEKISIVSDKPQTTRRRILGIRSTESSQMIFVDTPGIHRPHHSLNRRMMETVHSALKEVDLVVQMVDVLQRYGKGEQYVIDLVKAARRPTILALNKMDLINKAKVLPIIETYDRKCEFCEIIPLSVTVGYNLEVLREKIMENLPEGEFLYPPEYITDQQEQFMVSEIIREKVLAHAWAELPYSTAVQIDQFDESERQTGFLRVIASILVEKENQKKIVVGRGGQMVKVIGTEARRDIEESLHLRKVFLGLNVKTVENWRDRDDLLDQIGVG